MARASILLLLLNIFHLGFSLPAAAQDGRASKLVEEVKKEGALVWYLSASIEDARAIFLAFNKNIRLSKPNIFAPARPGCSIAS